VFLRYIGTAGAEILNTRGQTIKVARANIKPFLPEVPGEVSVAAHRGSVAEDSDSDWSIYDEDWDD
jgi:hypothetical protein